MLLVRSAFLVHINVSMERYIMGVIEEIPTVRMLVER